MRRFLLWASAGLGERWIPFAQALKERTGAEIHLVCSREADARMYREKGGAAFDAVHPIWELFMTPPDARDPEAVYARARANEERYGVLMTDLIQADRHLGQGFVSGSEYPRSTLGVKTNYTRSLELANRMLDFFADLLDELKPEAVVMTGVGGVHNKACAVVARHLGIPLRLLTSSSLQNYYYWAEDEFVETSRLELVYRRLEEAAPRAGEFLGRAVGPAVIRQRLVREYTSIPRLVRRMARDVALHVYRKLPGRRRVSSYYLGDTLRTRLRTFRDFRRFARDEELWTADRLKGKKYIFYPLQMEPEASVTVFSPEINNQLYIVEVLAKNAPSGVFVAVKEHIPGVGRRPRDFYARLGRMPSVLLVSPFENSLELIQGSVAIAILGGSAGIEAAIMGVPVISFGAHNLYNFLDHVWYVTSPAEVRRAVRAVCTDPGDPERRRRDGLRFQEALLRISFDMGERNIHFNTETVPAREEAERLETSLLESLANADQPTEESEAHA